MNQGINHEIREKHESRSKGPVTLCGTSFFDSLWPKNWAGGPGGQRGHGLTPSAARASRCWTGRGLNRQMVFPSGGNDHKIRLAQENGGTTPWQNLSLSIVAAGRRLPVRASRFTTLSITLK